MKTNISEKWYTETTYVDRDTGEIIPKRLINITHLPTNQITKKVENHESYRIIKRTIECYRIGQQLTIF